MRTYNLDSLATIIANFATPLLCFPIFDDELFAVAVDGELLAFAPFELFD